MKFIAELRASALLRAILLSGAALGALAGAPALAQTQQTQAGESTDEVVVTGRRPIAESEAAALQAQREFPSLVSIVAADTVGRFPDQNIAFAVGRLPGVGIQRDQGQARYVNLRGAPLNWTTLSFDGINVVSPEGRASRFDNVPSALAAQIQARKAVTPDMPGETLAGNINIVTRSAFDYEDRTFNAKAGIGYVTLGGGEEIDTSVVFADKFLNDTIGIVLSASYYRRNMVTDNFETDWEPVSQDQAQGNADRYWAREHENKLYRLTRRNRSLSGRLEWRPNDDTDLFVSSIYTEYRDDELRTNIKWDLDDRQSSTANTATCGTRITVSGGASGYADVCIGNTPLRGTVFGIDFDNNYNDLESVEYIWTNTLGGDHFVGGWDLNWRLNYTNTEDGSDAPALTDYDSPSSRTIRPSVVYDFTDRDLHKIQLFRTVQNANGSYSLGERVFSADQFATELNQLRRRWGGTQTDAYTAKVDAEREISLFVPTDVKVGIEYASRQKVSENTLYNITTNDIIAAGLPRTYDAIALQRPFLGEITLGYSFRYHGSDAARRLVDQAIASGRGTFTNTVDYDVTEEVLSSYLMGAFNFDWGNVILGGRVEQIENTGTAPATVNGGARQLLTVSSDQTLFFPSAHINWDLSDDKKLRISLNTGAARPDYDELAPSLTVVDENQSASGGNPFAEPEKAWGVDAYFEWYLQPRGIFSVGAFHKEVTDVLFDSSTRLGPVRFADGVDRSDYILNTLVNGFDGQITGFEIAYQQPAELLVERLGLPAWLGGFGVQANATFTESEATAPDGRTVALPGTSDLVANAILYYEKYGFSARLSYQYRTEWLDAIQIRAANPDGTLRPPVDGGDAYWDNDEELDFSLRYSVNDDVEWFFDASNLLDGPGRRYRGDEIRVIEYETFGPRYVTGVRVSF